MRHHQQLRNVGRACRHARTVPARGRPAAAAAAGWFLGLSARLQQRRCGRRAARAQRSRPRAHRAALTRSSAVRTLTHTPCKQVLQQAWPHAVDLHRQGSMLAESCVSVAAWYCSLCGQAVEHPVLPQVPSAVQLLTGSERCECCAGLRRRGNAAPNLQQHNRASRQVRGGARSRRRLGSRRGRPAPAPARGRRRPARRTRPRPRGARGGARRS